MKRLTSTLLPMLLSGGIAFVAVAEEKGADQAADPGLATLVAVYEKKLDELQRPLNELDQLYESRLKAIQEDRQKRGDLDQTLAVRKEMESFRGGAKTEIPEKFSELRNARTLYLRELEKRQPQVERQTQEAQRAFVQQLEEHQVALTRAGKLDAALAVKMKIDALQNAPAPEPLRIELFWEENYQGESVFLEVPCQVDRFAPRPDLKNDRLSSIRIPDGVKVTVATGARLELEMKTLEGDQAEIGLTGISSLKAELKTR